MANVHRRFSRCPHCRSILDAHAGQDEPPQTGDFTVCAYCGAILCFTVDDVRLATAEDLDAMVPATRDEFTAAANKVREMFLRRIAGTN